MKGFPLWVYSIPKVKIKVVNHQLSSKIAVGWSKQTEKNKRTDVPHFTNLQHLNPTIKSAITRDKKFLLCSKARWQKRSCSQDFPAQKTTHSSGCFDVWPVIMSHIDFPRWRLAMCQRRVWPPLLVWVVDQIDDSTKESATTCRAEEVAFGIHCNCNNWEFSYIVYRGLIKNYSQEYALQIQPHIHRPPNMQQVEGGQE